MDKYQLSHMLPDKVTGYLLATKVDPCTTGMKHFLQGGDLEQLVKRAIEEETFPPLCN